MTEQSADKNLLPTFLIIGANKAGTTSLHAYLSQHPDIFMCTPKEPMFFNSWGLEPQEIEERKKIAPYVFETVEQYQALFEGGRNMKARGESSTSYLANRKCAAKIRKLIPDVKIIAILRNPVDRAFSNYLMYVRWGKEKLKFEEAVDEEIRNGRRSVQHGMRYLALGKYSQSLETYYNTFSKDQIRIYLYEEFSKNPEKVLKDLFVFLGVDDSFVPDTKSKSNVNAFPRFSGFIDKGIGTVDRVLKKLRLKKVRKALSSFRYYKPALKDETKLVLKNYYREEVDRLEKITGRSFAQWRQS